MGDAAGDHPRVAGKAAPAVAGLFLDPGQHAAGAALAETKQNNHQKLAAAVEQACPRPMLASAIFFAIAFIINHSGKNADWQLVEQSSNMVYVIADAASQTFGKFYPLVAPYLGLLAGFISGSETSAIAMLTAIHLSTAEKIGAVGLLIAAASGIGGGLASVISPAKLQNAAASIDMIGEESKVIRVTFVISLVLTTVAAVMTMLWAVG